ncbi:MAG: YgfZ/GcvT domain-containing protein [Steroidobacteraceae bacterium]
MTMKARIHVGGADARQFLQGQLTADLSGVAPGEARLAAWCTAQGRVICVVTVAAASEGFDLTLPAELAAEVIHRLRRYILRARVHLEEPSTGSDAAKGPDEELAGVRAGLPEIYLSTTEQWIPQMLNLDLLGAIGFTKGCYPGQEIVTRTRHLGRVKRRMFRYHCEAAALAPRTALHLAGTQVGEVVRSARSPDGSECLAVVELEAAGQALVTATGAQCSPLALPYPIPELVKA